MKDILIIKNHLKYLPWKKSDIDSSSTDENNSILKGKRSCKWKLYSINGKLTSPPESIYDPKNGTTGQLPSSTIHMPSNSMLGYTNLDSEKGFAFFQTFLKETGILDELEAAGIQEGDTVRMYGLQFDYYK